MDCPLINNKWMVAVSAERDLVAAKDSVRALVGLFSSLESQDMQSAVL
jgi:hypothetical protein